MTEQRNSSGNYNNNNNKRLNIEMADNETLVEEEHNNERRDRLRVENEQNRLMSILVKEGKLAWMYLNETNKWKKESVLAVFKSGILPDEMLECNWYDNAPKVCTDDRDILLARLNTPQFADYYYKISPNEIFHLPKRLVNDKEIVCATIRQYPYILNQPEDDEIALEFYDDEEIFIVFISSIYLMRNAVSNRGNFINNCKQIINRFSERIRSNGTLMLHAAKQYQLIYEHIGLDLKNNCNFAITLITILYQYHYQRQENNNKPPHEILSVFTETVRSNPRVVMEYFMYNVHSLQHASTVLRQDENFIKAVCTHDPRALLYYSSEKGEGTTTTSSSSNLFSNKEFIMDIFNRINERGYMDTEDTFPTLYQNLSLELQVDVDVVIAASKIDAFNITDAPEVLLNDINFWITALQREPRIWEQTPITMKEEKACVHSITQFQYPYIVHEIFQYHPDLVSDIDLWWTIINSETPDGYIIYNDHGELEKPAFIASLLRPHGTREILHNHDLMIEACKKDADVIKVLPQIYRNKREFVEAAVNNDPKAMLTMTNELQLLYPDLFIISIQNFAQEDTLSAYWDFVDSRSWANYDVLETWLENDGVFPHSGYPKSLKTKPEFGLLLAKYKISVSRFAQSVHRKLRSDKTFMEQAITLHGKLLLCAQNGLRHDKDLFRIALSGNDRNDVLQLLLRNNEKNVLHFYQRIFPMLIQNYISFTKGFLPGMLCNNNNNTNNQGSSPLRMLLHDDDTVLGIKRNIASYLDLPYGNQIHSLRIATQVLQTMPKLPLLPIVVPNQGYQSDDDEEEED